MSTGVGPADAAYKLLRSIKAQPGWLGELELSSVEFTGGIVYLFENASAIASDGDASALCTLVRSIMSELGPELVHPPVPIELQLRYIRSMVPLFSVIGRQLEFLEVEGSGCHELLELRHIAFMWWDTVAIVTSGPADERARATWDAMVEVLLMKSDACAAGAVEGMVRWIAGGLANMESLGRALAKLGLRGRALPDAVGERLAHLAVFASAVASGRTRSS